MAGDPLGNVEDLRASDNPLPLSIFAMLLDLRQTDVVDSRRFSIGHALLRKGCYQCEAHHDAGGKELLRRMMSFVLIMFDRTPK